MASPTVPDALRPVRRRSTGSAPQLPGDYLGTGDALLRSAEEPSERARIRPGPSGSGTPTDASDTPTRALPVWTRGGDLRPSGEELQISSRILLHIASATSEASEGSSPESLTQAGMAAALRTSQGAVSNALRRLVYGGVLRVERVHVSGKLRRLKVYRLTPEGENLVRWIRENPRP